MPTLQVSDLRAAVLRAADAEERADSGAPSTGPLGTLLHRVFAELIGDDERLNLHAALSAADDSPAAWKAAILDHAYRHVVGPDLLRQRAALQDSSRQVLDFWTACQELCGWLSELLWTIREESDAVGVSGHRNVEATLRESRMLWPHLAVEVISEEPHSLTLHEPHWRSPVRISGVPDAVFRLRSRGQWCVIELKSGRTSPEADLLQACLYHQMLSAEAGRSNSEGQLALVSFLPERRERLFSAAQLSEAQTRITELAGRLAGVLADDGEAATAVPTQPRASAAVPAEPAATKPSETPVTDVRPAVERSAAADSPSPSASLAQSPEDEHRELAERMRQAFREYKADVMPDGDPIVGPTFLRFPVTLGHGVRVATVKNRAAEVQLRLGLDRPPLISQQQGQVLIDVQRPDRQFIGFSAIRDQFEAPDPRNASAKVPIGVDLYGELQFADLSQTEHAHILVAGTTGSGKSEWLRAAIAGLMVSHTPETLRLVLIDPKRVAFHDLRESPYLLRPLVFPDEEDVTEVLSGLADEMDRRYRLFAGDQSLADYVSRTGNTLPRIVCICDEYFDLINRSPAERKSIEAQMQRLGAKARAAGIHLIIATQQPSRQVIQGALDTNIPARVGLKLSDAIESRRLLGTRGAECLLNHGDLLFKDIGEPRRLQAPWIPPDEREALFGELS